MSSIKGRTNYDDYFGTMVPIADGGYLLGGSSPGGIGGDKSEANKGYIHTYDYWVIKVDSNGIKEWDKTIGGSADDILTTAVLATDEGYLLGGYSLSNYSSNEKVIRSLS